MNVPGGRQAKRVVLESAGWLLVVVGIILMPLPGPGLLIVLAGVALLARQYEWADRRLTAVRLRALREAARSVASPTSMAATLLGVATLAAAGTLWIISPTAPGWWPVRESWWLPGGLWTGVFQIISALFALGMMIYSYRRFHSDPEALAALEQEIDQTSLVGGGRPTGASGASGASGAGRARPES